SRGRNCEVSDETPGVCTRFIPGFACGFAHEGTSRIRRLAQGQRNRLVEVQGAALRPRIEEGFFTQSLASCADVPLVLRPIAGHDRRSDLLAQALRRAP